MDRRYYLGLLATGLVGTTRAQEQTETQTTPSGCPPETATTTDTSTATANETAPTTTPTVDGLEIVSTSYEEVEDSFLTEAGVWVDVANASDVTWSYVEVSAAFRDADDTVVDDGFTNMLHLPPCETWRTYISNFGPETAESATVEITDSTRGEPLPTADDLGLTLEEVRMTEPGPTVIGRVTNTTGGPLDYLEAIVRFRDDEYVYDGTFTNVSNLAAGDTWRFEIQFSSVAPEPPTITDYDLRFATPFDIFGANEVERRTSARGVQ